MSPKKESPAQTSDYAPVTGSEYLPASEAIKPLSTIGKGKKLNDHIRILQDIRFSERECTDLGENPEAKLEQARMEITRLKHGVEIKKSMDPDDPGRLELESVQESLNEVVFTRMQKIVGIAMANYRTSSALTSTLENRMTKPEWDFYFSLMANIMKLAGTLGAMGD